MPDSFSPYFPLEKTGIDEAFDKVMNNIATEEEALAVTQERINRMIQESVNNNPTLKKQYEAGLVAQKKIDDCKKFGKKIPKSLISNPFHLAYYRSKGVLDETK